MERNLINKEDTNLKENEAYIIKNGKPELVEKPLTGFGKTVLNWQDGKIVSKEISYTVR